MQVNQMYFKLEKSKFIRKLKMKSLVKNEMMKSISPPMMNFDSYNKEMDPYIEETDLHTKEMTLIIILIGTILIPLSCSTIYHFVIFIQINRGKFNRNETTCNK